MLTTADAPVDLRLTPDRATNGAAAGDLSYVTVEIVDAQGAVIRRATHQVTLEVTGAGELIAIGSPDPRSEELYIFFREETPLADSLGQYSRGRDKLSRRYGRASGDRQTRSGRSQHEEQTDDTTIAHRLMGDWEPTPAFYAALLGQETSDADVSRPYPFCLAHPFEGELSSGSL
jgi:hypothetical protein